MDDVLLAPLVVEEEAGGRRSRLLADQRTQVGVLADQLVAGGEVEDDVGSFHRQQGTDLKNFF